MGKASNRPKTEMPVPGAGLRALDMSDAWWLAAWKRYRRVDILAQTIGIHDDDVRARLRNARVSMRGRPPRNARYVAEAPLGKTVDAMRGPVQFCIPGV